METTHVFVPLIFVTHDFVTHDFVTHESRQSEGMREVQRRPSGGPAATRVPPRPGAVPRQAAGGGSPLRAGLRRTNCGEWQCLPALILPYIQLDTSKHTNMHVLCLSRYIYIAACAPNRLTITE